jgi:hypothetical protein
MSSVPNEAAALTITGELPTWSSISEEYEWGGILLGNGASCVIWPPFEYPSLFDAARSPELEGHLESADEALFAALDTRNFERVLGALRQSREVCDSLGVDSVSIQSRYGSIRSALVAAVHSVHPTWLQVPENILRAVGKQLLEYEVIYTTNYDLLVYWSRMSVNDGVGFKDYFWGPRFDLADTEISGKVTRVLNLHGGLHLYRKDGATHKRKRQPGENLLEQFTSIFEEGGIPLFVSEGSSSDKLVAIESNDYLSFAYAEFSRDHRPLVVFGHSLQDEHIRAGMAGPPWETRTIAISVPPGSADETIARKMEFHQLLPEARLLFFDATSHPLGAPELRLEIPS